MSVTEERTGGEIAAGIRRISRLGGKHFLGRLQVKCAYVGVYILVGGKGRKCKNGGQQRGESYLP
jgi:hypothetical protein